MNGKKRAAALFTSAAMALSLAACGSSTSWAARSGQTTMPAGVYILSQIDAYYDAQDALKEAGVSWDSSSKPSEIKKLVFKSQVDGQPAEDFISQKAGEYVQTYFAAQQLAAERGVALTAEDEAVLKSNNDLLWQYSEDFYTQNGISKDSVSLMTSNYLLQNRLFSTIYGEGGERAVSEEQYQSYYTESRIRVRYLPLAISASLSDEEKAALEEKANGYLERVQKGENLTALIEEYQNELYDEMQKAAEEAAGSGSSSSTAQSEPAERPVITEGQFDLILTKDSGSPSQALTDEMFSAPEGEARLVQDENAFYIAMRVDPMFSAEDYEALKPTLLQEMKGEEFNQWLVEQGSAIEITYNAEALGRFTPQKIDFKGLDG